MNGVVVGIGMPPFGSTVTATTEPGDTRRERGTTVLPPPRNSPAGDGFDAPGHPGFVGLAGRSLLEVGDDEHAAARRRDRKRAVRSGQVDVRAARRGRDRERLCEAAVRRALGAQVVVQRRGPDAEADRHGRRGCGRRAEDPGRPPARACARGKRDDVRALRSSLLEDAPAQRRRGRGGRRRVREYGGYLLQVGELALALRTVAHVLLELVRLVGVERVQSVGGR